ncbi:hypothetical protein BH10ACI2_BH10ACI2_23730 [soil metagenome]
MLIAFTIGLGLFVQNIRPNENPKDQNADVKNCQYCLKPLNPEAYVCRFCHKELYEYKRV